MRPSSEKKSLPAKVRRRRFDGCKLGARGVAPSNRDSFDVCFDVLKINADRASIAHGDQGAAPRMGQIERNEVTAARRCIQCGFAIRSAENLRSAGLSSSVAREQMPQYAMRHDKVVAAYRVHEAIRARSFGAAQRLTALLEACGRSPEVEGPYIDAARRNAQIAVRGADERRILGQ